MAINSYPNRAFKRIARALPDMDKRAHEVIAYHLALERELDQALAVLLPRADKLRGLGFGQKVSVLQALSNNGWIDLVAQALIQFNNLRNAIAHGDSKVKVDQMFASLCKAAGSFSGVDVGLGQAKVGGLASGIGLALAVDTEEAVLRFTDRMGSRLVH